MAHAFIKSGIYKQILVVGAEIQNVWQDLTTRGRGAAPIFGDGAGAIVFSAVEDASDILSHTVGSNGNTEPLNVLVHNGACGETWGRSDADYAFILPNMQGNKVFKHAVRETVASISEVLTAAGLAMENVNWFLPTRPTTILMSPRPRSLTRKSKTARTICRFSRMIAGCRISRNTETCRPRPFPCCSMKTSRITTSSGAICASCPLMGQVLTGGRCCSGIKCNAQGKGNFF